MKNRQQKLLEEQQRDGDEHDMLLTVRDEWTLANAVIQRFGEKDARTKARILLVDTISVRNYFQAEFLAHGLSKYTLRLMITTIIWGFSRVTIQEANGDAMAGGVGDSDAGLC